jgi:hypothetical protein
MANAEEGFSTRNKLNGIDFGLSSANEMKKDIAGTRRNRLLVSAIYQLPVRRNRAFLNRMNSIGDTILGGWK